MPELVCTGVTALNVVRRAEEEWKDAVQLLSCFNVTLSRWATSFQDRVAPARVCDGFDVGLVGSALAPGEGAKAGQGRECEITLQAMKDIVNYHDAKRQQYRGNHGGFVYKFTKQVSGKTMSRC